MAVPRGKKSKQKIRARRRAHKVALPAVKACPNCQASHQPHRVCPACGYYKGRQVLTVAAR